MWPWFFLMYRGFPSYSTSNTLYFVNPFWRITDQYCPFRTQNSINFHHQIHKVTSAIKVEWWMISYLLRSGNFMHCSFQHQVRHFLDVYTDLCLNNSFVNSDNSYVGYLWSRLFTLLIWRNELMQNKINNAVEERPNIFSSQNDALQNLFI